MEKGDLFVIQEEKYLHGNQMKESQLVNGVYP